MGRCLQIGVKKSTNWWRANYRLAVNSLQIGGRSKPNCRWQHTKL